MNKLLLLLVFTLFIKSNASAQSKVDSVKAVINKMFAAMKSADTASFRSVIADNALLQSVSQDKGGKTIVRNEPMTAFINFIATQQSGDLDERIRFDMVKVDGPLASVWTPYQFRYKGKFSHCGVNSFQLVRMDNAWKIQYIIDTRRIINCD